MSEQARSDEDIKALSDGEAFSKIKYALVEAMRIATVKAGERSAAGRHFAVINTQAELAYAVADMCEHRYG